MDNWIKCPECGREDLVMRKRREGLVLECHKKCAWRKLSEKEIVYG